VGVWLTLAAAFRFARRSVRYWPIGVVAMLGTAQVTVIHVEDAAPLFASNPALHDQLAGSPGTAIATAAGVVVLILGSWLLSEIALAAIIVGADAALQQRQPAAGDLWRAGSRMLGRVVAVDVLTVVPVLTPILVLAALATAAMDAGAAADLAERLLDFVTSGLYAGFAVILAIIVWAWRDLALRHTVLGGESPMEAIHAAVSDLGATFLKTSALGAALFIVSWVVSFVLLPLLYALDALGSSGMTVLTPGLAWQWYLFPAAVFLAPYALLDTAAWTYWYRLLHPSVIAGVADV